jgi:hypothetical protein
MTENNSAPFSVEHFRSICGCDTLRSKAHCLFKVLNFLVALMCNYILEGKLSQSLRFEVASQMKQAAFVTDGQSNVLGNLL